MSDVQEYDESATREAENVEINGMIIGEKGSHSSQQQVGDSLVVLFEISLKNASLYYSTIV